MHITWLRCWTGQQGRRLTYWTIAGLHWPNDYCIFRNAAGKYRQMFTDHPGQEVHLFDTLSDAQHFHEVLARLDRQI